MQPKITFDPSLRQTYGDGKYFIYRKVDTGEYLPYDETYTDIYVDTNPVLGATNNYVYKFVTGARDTPLFGPITHYVPMPPTPTPTCAFYLYDYSHEVTHPNPMVNRVVGGRYTYMQTADGKKVLENESATSTILYHPVNEKWYMFSETTAVYIRSGFSSTGQLFLGPARNRGTLTKTFSRGYSAWTLTINVDNAYLRYGGYTSRFYWNKSRTGGRYYFKSWNWYRRRWYYTPYYVVFYDNLADVPQSYFNHGGGVDMLSDVYFTHTQESEGPPPDEWTKGSWWKIDLGGSPVVSCFRPTPTPTAIPVEPLPTPSPTAYPITPTATQIPIPTNYFMTEWSAPLITETGDYLVRE